MILACIVFIEAPVREDGQVIRHGVMASTLRKLMKLGFRVSHCGREESGAWDQDNLLVRRVRAEADLTPPQMDELVAALDLESRGDEVEILGGGGGFLSVPSISFDGVCRFTDRFDPGERGILDAFVTPYPSFDPVNRCNDEAWMRRAWARVTRAVLARWG